MNDKLRRRKLNKYYRQLGIASGSLILGLSLLSTLLPDKQISESEKRALAAFPEISSYSVLSGNFSEGFEDYASDQIAGRDLFVKLYSVYNQLTGSDISNDVYSCSDGYLIEKMKVSSEEKLNETLSSINHFTSRYDIPATFVMVPNAVSIYEEKLPAFAITDDQLAWSEAIRSNLSINYIDLRDVLLTNKDTNQLYYRTDHHWTSLAACASMGEVIDNLHCDLPGEISYSASSVCDSFVGSLAAKSGKLSSKKDSIYLYYPYSEISYTVTNVANKTRSDSIYNMDMLESSDPYTVFLGGNSSRIDITTDREDGARLLVFKDSYFNSFLPFLIDKYKEIDIVDPRYYYDDINMLMLEKNYDEILFFYNMNTFVNDTSIKQVLGTSEALPPESEAPTVNIPVTTPDETTSDDGNSETTTESESDTLPEETTSSSASSDIVIPAEWAEQINNANITTLTDEELAAIRAQLSNTIIIGDSMAQAALEYGLLDDMHVAYIRGATVDLLGPAITEAAGLSPERVIFFTGLNDANRFIDYNEYTAEYLNRVNELRALLPDVEIYICSMLPPSDALGAVRDDLVRAPYFSIALQQMCEVNNINYIDTYWMVNQKLYMEDGIHFKSSFYHMWMRYISLIITGKI